MRRVSWTIILLLPMLGLAAQSPVSASPQIPPLIGMSMPNLSGCGASTFDVYAGLGGDTGNAASINLSSPTSPTLAASGTSFSLFWGFVDHTCGPIFGAAANTFSYTSGPGTGEFTISDLITYWTGTAYAYQTFTVADIHVTKPGIDGPVPATLVFTDFMQGDFSGLPGISAVVTGYDIAFNLGTDPPITAGIFVFSPSGSGPVSFSAIPEPGTLAAFASGIFGLGMVSRRRAGCG